MEIILEEPLLAYKAKRKYTEAEYLAMDGASEIRLEFYDGEIVVKDGYFDGDKPIFQGASIKHEDIVANIVGEIRNKLKGTNCRIRAGNVRTRTKTMHSYFYPDATITCGSNELADATFDTLLNPVVIFEVLSPSSQNDDYGKKFMFYRQIPSLQIYILINSFSTYEVDVYTRTANNSWEIVQYHQLENSIPLSCIGINMSLSEMYEHIIF